MWKTIKQQMALDVCDYFFYYLLEVVFAAVGTLVMYCVVYFGNEEDYFPLGTVISGMCVLTIFLLGTGFSLYMGYNMAVSMGKTRRQYLLGAVPIHFFMTFLGVVLLGILMRAEFGIYRMAFPSLKEEGASILQVSVLWAVAAAGLITGTMFLGTAIMCRFKKGRVVLLIAWILGCWIIPSTLDKENNNILLNTVRPAVMGFVGLSESARLAAAIGLGILFGVIGCVMMRKLEVE